MFLINPIYKQLKQISYENDSINQIVDGNDDKGLFDPVSTNHKQSSWVRSADDLIYEWH